MNVIRGVAIAGLLFALSGCDLILSYIEGAVRLTNTDPTFVVKNASRPDTVVVFVHGVFGDTIDTWESANGTSFFSLLGKDPEFKGKFDIYAFGFSSNYFKQGSFSIGEAAKRMRLYADKDLAPYKRIVFVAHSMGGLVTMTYLLMDRRTARRVPLLVLFSTPQDANQLAAIAKRVAKNDGLVDMRESRDNRFFDDLEDRWKEASPEEKPRVICAYEKRKTFNVLIVPGRQATRYCDGATPAIDADHITIVKPDSDRHDSYLVAARALGAEMMKPAKYVSPFTARQEFEIQSLERIIQNNIVNTPQEALKDAEELIERYPTYANGYRLKGVALWNMGRFNEALVPNSKGLSLDAEVSVKRKLLFNRTSALLALGRVSEATPLLDELDKIDPNDDEARLLRALERLHARDYGTATTKFQELLSLKTPGASPFVRLALGFTLGLAASGQDRTAVGYFREAISQDCRIQQVFSAANGPLMLENWNYAVFRELYQRNRNRPTFRNLAF